MYRSANVTSTFGIGLRTEIQLWSRLGLGIGIKLGDGSTN